MIRPSGKSWLRYTFMPNGAVVVRHLVTGEIQEIARPRHSCVRHAEQDSPVRPVVEQEVEAVTTMQS